jgi:Adenylate cyclase, family 3 (some proteins contain HAMP domain)
MSTILRIGSLMKVGFGKAGAEIIRQSLEQQLPNDIAFLRRKSSDTNVSCIFLFCDIRRFTDTTECLLEEVFVFTNKIAAVVHSICHSYGGSANKNIGDAFLVSWVLKERNDNRNRSIDDSKRDNSGKKPADIALLAVIKIIIALNYESFFLDDLSPEKRKQLKTKFIDTVGPLVQMGFGLHAGKAVQGAIGSRRKLDATYISNAVEQAEYLESSTKRYGVQILMSGTFYNMLSQGVQRRCRKIDQVYFRDDDGDQFEEPTNPEDYEKMELYTHDIDVSHLDFNISSTNEQSFSDKMINEYKKVPLAFGLTSKSLSSGTSSNGHNGTLREGDTKGKQSMKDVESKDSRRAISIWNSLNYPELSDRFIHEKIDDLVEGKDTLSQSDETLALPTEQCIYKPSIWLSDDMRVVRGKYAGGDFFQKFNVGLQHYFDGEWSAAKQAFEEIDGKINDGPCKYYLNKMKETNFVVPRSFAGWNEA